MCRRQASEVKAADRRGLPKGWSNWSWTSEGNVFFKSSRMFFWNVILFCVGMSWERIVEWRARDVSGSVSSSGTGLMSIFSNLSVMSSEVIRDGVARGKVLGMEGVCRNGVGAEYMVSVETGGYKMV